MPRPAPWRLAPAAYPHMQTVQTRFQDMDVLGHINNVAFAALFETGRVKFNEAIGLMSLIRHRRSVVARVEINYLAEGQYPGDVEIGAGIGDVGGRSWDILAAMFQHGRCIATCDVTIVMAKGPDGEGLPEEFRTRLAGWLVRTE